MNVATTPPVRIDWRRIAVPAALLLAVILLAGYVLLPLAAERLLAPIVFKTAGIREYDLAVQRLSPFELDLGRLRIGPEGAPGITVASVTATYRPGELLQRRMSRLVLDDVRILVQENEKGDYRIPGLPTAAAGGPTPPMRSLPAVVARVEIRKGQISVQSGDRLLRLPFEGTFRPTADASALEGLLKLSVPDSQVTVGGRIDLSAGQWSLQWHGSGLRLEELGRMAGLKDGPAISGAGGIQGRAQGRLSPLAVDTLDATLDHTPCRLNWANGRLDLSGGKPDEDLRMTIRSDKADTWAIGTSPILAAMKGGEGLFALTGSLKKGEDGSLSWQGRLASKVAVISDQTGGPVVALPLNLQSTARILPDGSWQADLHLAESDAAAPVVAFDAGQPSIPLDLSGFEVTAEGQLKPVQADFRWRIAALKCADGALRLAVETIEGVGHYQRKDRAESGSLAMTLGPATVSSSGLTARLTKAQLAVEGPLDGDRPTRLSGVFSIAGGGLTMDSPAVKASGLSAHLPVAWPPLEKGKAGTLALASTTWEGRALGAVTGRLQQTMEGASFEARHESRLVPHLKVLAQGEAGLRADTGAPFAHIRWTADRPADAPPLALSDLMDQPPDVPVTLGGSLFARGEMRYENGLQGSLTAGLASGRLQVDDHGLVIDGLQSTLAIPDLRQLRSAPAQSMTFETVSIGTVRAENGRLAYQIEPGPVIFLEDGRFQWCGGTVISPAMRLVAGRNVYDVTLFCDRIKLDALLEQLGMAQVEGGGAISGLIPVVLADGRLTFNNAFLYSSPGEGGVIRVQGSEVLTAGIPPGTPQYNQMELARYALKDYDYQWAKVSMNSVADDLLVELQFDGKPAGPLPFEYDAETGGFVKAAPGQPGSVFQGIRLDVNVTLPLNRMLRYRELFKRLQ
jgi:hypothetical protein